MSITHEKFDHSTSYSLGEAVLTHTTNLAKQLFKSRLLACYALGSLAHGGFSILVSDVDIAIIIEDSITANDINIINSIQETIRNSAIPLAERLSIFWGSLNSLQNKGEFGRFPPLDKLDLIENGRLLTGKDIRSLISKPTKSELVIMGAKFALEMLATPELNKEIKQPTLLYKKGVRHLTKIILFPVRLLYTSLTGKIGHNGEAVEYYLVNNHDDKAKLVEAAFNWRSAMPENETHAVQLIDKSLIELYIQFIDEYHEKMFKYNETKIANDLIKWRERLVKNYF